jgi:hypothetical protein
MATTSSIGSLQNTFKISIPGTRNPIFAKINWAFGFSMACLAAGVSYWLYTLHQVYQLTTHTGFGLDDRFKFVKCYALLLEAREKETTQNIEPLLQQCESLLASITGRMSLSSFEKEGLLLKLAQCYAKNDPERSILIAKRLSSSYALFNAAQSIQEKHPRFTIELREIYRRAFEARLIEWDRPNHKLYIMDIEGCLKIAQAFLDLHDSGYAGTIVERMEQSAETLQLPLDRILAFSKIAEYAHKTKRGGCLDFSIRRIQEILKQGQDRSSPEGLVFTLQTHLILANTFFSIGEFEKMDRELDEVISLFAVNPLTTQNQLYSLQKLIKAISKDKVQSRYNKFADVFDMIRKAFHDIPGLPDQKNRARAYLDFATNFKEGLVNEPATKVNALIGAFGEIQTLPDQTKEEINSKMDLLCSILYFCKEDPARDKAIMLILEGLYDRCPLDDTKRLWDKFGLGSLIVGHYNKMGLSAESETFFSQKYLPIFQNGNKAFDKISKLTSYAVRSHVSDSHFAPQQTIMLLEAAERLVPQLSSNDHEFALRMIAQGYLDVNRQKSLSLLASFENTQAQFRLITTAVCTVALGILYFYPQAAPVIILGSTVVQLFWR